MFQDNMHLPIRMTNNRGKGETVEAVRRPVVRSLAGKDKRSKICTSKGSRDRRIRLSANTAIQFYDVQDRLGFDRPSNAIDWLMKEAKAAIDVLNEDHYHQHLQELLALDTTTTSAFNLSEAFHPTPGEPSHQNLNQDQIDGFNKSELEILDSRNGCQSQDGNPIPVDRDDDFHSSTIRRDLSWNPNCNDAEGFEFGNVEPRESSFLHPNESYDLMGISFEEEMEAQEKEDSRSYDHELGVFETNCC